MSSLHAGQHDRNQRRRLSSFLVDAIDDVAGGAPWMKLTVERVTVVIYRNIESWCVFMRVHRSFNNYNLLQSTVSIVH